MKSLRQVSPQNIIVRMPNWIGDLVMATPILADLRARYRQAHITAMCRSPICELLKEDPHIDELFCFKKANGFMHRAERRNIVEKLRKGKYDLGILLTHSFSSAWWFRLGRIQHRLGYEGKGRNWLLSCSIPFPKQIQNQHLVLTYKALLEPLGITPTQTPPRLYLNPKEKEEAGSLLKKHGVAEDSIVIGINPGATYGSAKCWLPDRFRKVTEKLLLDPQIHIVYFGDQNSASLVKEICRGLPPRVINLAGLTSLRELASLICCCTLLLTNDSGPMHVADALDIPIVALFGSTSDVVTGPYSSGRIVRKEVECSPCYERTCPIDFRCMKQIEADEVYDTVMSIIHQGRTKLHVIP